MPDNMQQNGLIDTPEEREKRKQEEERRRASRQRCLQLWFNGILMLFTGLTATIALYQNHVLNNSLSEMRTQSSLMNEGLKETRAQTQAMIASLGETQKQTAAMKEAAEAATNQSRAAQDGLTLTRENFNRGERAWLTVTQFALSNEITTDSETFQVIYFIDNTGNTPALEQTAQGLVYFTADEPPIPVLAPPGIRASENIVPPSRALIHSRTKPTRAPSAVVAKEYVNKKRKMYTHMLIRYRDVFNIPHWTRVCAYHTYGDPLNAWSYCHSGNEMDRNEQATDPADPPPP